MNNPLDGLSYMALLFLRDKTDFSEPWMGFGFASTMREHIEIALAKKIGDDPIKKGVVEKIIGRKLP